MNEAHRPESYKDQLYRQYQELGLKIALLELQEEEAQALEAQIETQSDAEADAERAFFARTQREALRKIDRRLSARQARRFTRQTLPRVAQAAACLLLIFFVGMTTAVATVQSVRVKVLNFLINIEEEYTELSLVEDESASFDVPAEWTGNYYPAYIPEEFEIVEVNNDGGYIYFRNKQTDQYIEYSEYTQDAYVNIDTEDAEIRQYIIRGKSALIVSKNDKTTITWAENDRYFIVDTSLDPEDAIKIAEKVVRIK